MRTQRTAEGIETSVVLAHAIEDSTDMFQIWVEGLGFNHKNPPWYANGAGEVYLPDRRS